MSHLQIIAELETVTEMQARVIKIMATRLAEPGDTVTGRDEIAQADKAYRDAIGGDELGLDLLHRLDRAFHRGIGGVDLRGDGLHVVP